MVISGKSIQSRCRVVFSPSLAWGQTFFRGKRILAQHRQEKTLCVFVRSRRGSSSAVGAVNPWGEADKHSGRGKFLLLQFLASSLLRGC